MTRRIIESILGVEEVLFMCGQTKICGGANVCASTLISRLTLLMFRCSAAPV
jgi:hypothetical protein